MRTMGATSILIAVLALNATMLPRAARANVIVFQDRIAFVQALNNPSLVKTVEGWDTYPAGTIFADGSTVNGITYNVSSPGDALVVSSGISLSPPNNLFMTDCATVQTCSFPTCRYVHFRIPAADSRFWHYLQQHLCDRQWRLLTDD